MKYGCFRADPRMRGLMASSELTGDSNILAGLNVPSARVKVDVKNLIMSLAEIHQQIMSP
jgi:hypothetical protein